MATKGDIHNLDNTARIDDRWTESKLVAAGYQFTGDGACKSCGDPVSFYKRERNYNQSAQWKVLNEGVLSVHVCQGRS